MGVQSATLNPSHQIWNTTKEGVGSVSKHLSEIKNDPDGLQYYADLFLEVVKDLPAPLRKILENVTASEDSTRFFQDFNHFVSSKWRTASYLVNFQMASFVTIEVCGTIAAAAKIGLFSLAATADKLSVASALLGKSFLVATGIPFIMGLTGVGYFFHGADTAVKHSFVDSYRKTLQNRGAVTPAEAQRQADAISNYYKIIMARCATKMGACGLFVYGAVAKTTLISATAIACSTGTLAVATLALAILGFHYKRSYDHAKVIEKFEDRLTSSENYKKHLPPVDRKSTKGETLFSKTFKVSETIAGSNEPMEKIAKGIPAVIYCSKAIANFVATTAFDNPIFRYIARNPGVTTFAQEASQFSSTISGIKFWDRARELATPDAQGKYPSQSWSPDKLNNRRFLTVSHFMDFLRILKNTTLFELSFLSAKVVFSGWTLSVKMIKDAAVIGASFFGYKNANTEIENNNDKETKAGTKIEKSIANYSTFDTQQILDKYSNTIVTSEKTSLAKNRQGSSQPIPISEVTSWKHEYLNGLAGGSHTSMIKYEERTNEAEAKIDEINKSWGRFFKTAEVRKLNKEIANCEAIEKVYAWYQAPSITMYAGTKITLNSGLTMEVSDWEEVELPVGTKIQLPNSQKAVTLKAPVQVTFSETITLSGTPAQLQCDATVTLMKDDGIQQAYALKNLGKAFRWDKAQAVFTSLKEILEEKRSIIQRYEPCKATICAVGILLAAVPASLMVPFAGITLASALVPTVNVLGVIVSSMDVYKYVREKQIEEKKNSDLRYAPVATAIY